MIELATWGLYSTLGLGVLLVVLMFLILGLGLAGWRQCARCGRSARGRDKVFCTKCGGVLQWPAVRKAS
jgi:rRNA maturation endonuclease Nob1